MGKREHDYSWGPVFGHDPFAGWAPEGITRGYGWSEARRMCENGVRLCHVEEGEDGAEVLVCVFSGELGNVCGPVHFGMGFEGILDES